MAIGFGVSPFGTSPFAGVYGVGWGIGAVDPFGGSAPTPPKPTAAKCRKRTLTGDYERRTDSTGLAEGDPVDEAVVFALRTVKGTFVDQSVGNGVTRILVNRSAADTHAKVLNEVNLALAPIVARGLLKNVAVTDTAYVRNGASVLAYQVSYDKTGTRS